MHCIYSMASAVLDRRFSVCVLRRTHTKSLHAKQLHCIWTHTLQFALGGHTLNRCTPNSCTAYGHTHYSLHTIVAPGCAGARSRTPIRSVSFHTPTNRVYPAKRLLLHTLSNFLFLSRSLSLCLAPFLYTHTHLSTHTRRGYNQQRDYYYTLSHSWWSVR